MLRLAMLGALISCCGYLTGCCGPCGPGGGFGGNIGYGGGCGPLESLVMMKKRLACGDGCGETYYGEWRSHAPSCDPCEFDYTYHGGGSGACGGCGSCDSCLFSPPPRRRPLMGLFASIYGDRYCEGCGQYGYYDGGCGDGGCGDGGYGGGGYGGGGYGGGYGYGGGGNYGGYASMPKQRAPMATAQRGRPTRTNAGQVMIPEPRRVARQPSSQPSTGRQR